MRTLILTKPLVFITLVYMVEGISKKSDHLMKSMKCDHPYKSKNKLVLLSTVRHGRDTALAECQEMFKWDRWNCSTSLFEKRTELPVTKEMAFASSLTAAGIALAVAEACSEGRLEKCKCKKNKRFKKYCTSDLHFGQRKALNILKKADKEAHHVKAMVNLHNYRIGVKAIEKIVQNQCSCRGPKDLWCDRKCWSKHASIGNVASLLKGYYYRLATKISSNTEVIPKSLKDQMLFLEKSPKYCQANKTLNIAGTKGRLCSKNKYYPSDTERRSCRHLCTKCGLEVMKRKYNVTEDCHCEFKWCCTVKCDKCTREVTEYYCG